ncbi:Na+ dependent nucleoside transporter [Flavobacteriaceae bacterium]|jgi:CNT family concentrative nucleoside transporter|nr:Na+ dependent nucleoside transporter [Flavobacteriaceae bacterium]MDB2350066.1 Na+ dependent nucleoside transporter [Flavobacteriaceae bacterium]
MLKKLSILLFIFSFNSIFSQSIVGDWFFQNIQDSNGNELFEVKKTDLLSITEKDFKYNLEAKNNLQAEGSYSISNNKLSFNYNTPSDTLRTYDITLLSENELEFTENGISYKFQKIESLIPSQGFSISGMTKGITGMVFLIFIAFLFSKNRKAIKWKTVFIGLAAQLLLAVGVLKVNFIQQIFEFFGKIFVKTLDFTMEGSTFLLGDMMNVESFGYVFLFQVLPTVIFFSALTSVLFYLGVIQKFVKALAWALTKLLNISGAESLSVAGNIFLGQTEAPLMIKAYLEKMSKSEILLVMVGGMATVAGGVLAAYIGFLGGEDEIVRLFYAKHLLTASVMAAPGAIVISKILYPQTEKINTEVHVSQEKIGSNLLDAIANGTTEGLKLAANVGAMLLVFVAFIAMINFGFEKIGTIGQINNWISSNTSYDQLSIEFILGYTFSPLMWLIGVAKEDMALMGQLLGIKLAVSEFIGYMQLAELKDITNLIHFKYEKSIIMATYMLCGFANFASIGIQIGGIGSLAPGQRKNLSEFGFLALIGGTLASLLSATFAGMIIG